MEGLEINERIIPLILSNNKSDLELVVTILQQYPITKDNIIFFLFFLSIIVVFFRKDTPLGIPGFSLKYEKRRCYTLGHLLYHKIYKYLNQYCSKEHSRTIMENICLYTNNIDSILDIQSILMKSDPVGKTYSIKYWK